MVKMTLARLGIFTLAFAYGLPLLFAVLPGGSVFTGGLLAGFLMAVAYIAVLFAFAAVAQGIMDARKFTIAQKRAAAPWTAISIFIISTLFFLVAPHVVPGVIAVSGLVPALASAAVLQLILMATLKLNKCESCEVSHGASNDKKACSCSAEKCANNPDCCKKKK